MRTTPQELSALRQRVSRLSPRNAEAAAMRVAVIAVACGWGGLDPLAPAARKVADEAFLDLWAAIAQRIDHDQFVALPTLALHNWAPERKPRRHIPIDQLARTEPLVPIVRWAPEGQPLSRLDRLMLAATRLEAHGIWLFRLAETLAGRSPDDSSTPTALRRLVRIQHALRAQLRAETAELADAPAATTPQSAVLAALAEQGALEPPVLQAADAVLGIGGRRVGEGGRQHQRRHLPAQHRAWLSAMDRHCAPVRTLAHRGGPGCRGLPRGPGVADRAPAHVHRAGAHGRPPGIRPPHRGGLTSAGGAVGSGRVAGRREEGDRGSPESGCYWSGHVQHRSLVCVLV